MHERFGLFIGGSRTGAAGGAAAPVASREGGSEGIPDYLDTRPAQVVF